MEKIGKEKIACGVAGVGYLGQHHARIYHELDVSEFIGFYEPNEQAAQKIKEAYSVKRFSSLEELAKECDAVSVVCPTDLHAEVSIPLLDYGCHLLVEKPLCTSSTEAELILSRAKENKLIVQVGHIEHYNPVMDFLEEAVDAPKYLTVDRLAPFQPRGTEVGVVLDLMIHDIGIALALVSSPLKSVDAIGVRVLSQTEDIANARLVFENGCVANLNASRVSEKKAREIRVFQDSGYLSLDFMNQKGHFIQKKEMQLLKNEVPVAKGEPLALEIASFLDCVLKAKTPKTDGSFGKSALEVALNVTKKIESGW